MLGRHGVGYGAAPSSVFCGGGRGGQPHRRGRTPVAHGAAVAQPPDSRPRYEVGAQLLTRSARGIELTAAGRAFLDHARLALAQAQAAVEAARRAAQPAKPSFALGFLTGQEMDWLPEAMHILKDELPNIDVTVSSNSSPRLADDLTRGKLDLVHLAESGNSVPPAG